MVVTGLGGFANAQVAKGGQVGLLGFKDRMSTPFSQTVYTEAMIQDRQAVTLAEVLELNPSVQRSGGRLNGNDSFVIRGFAVNGYDISYDGLYGLSSVRHNSVFTVGAIEVTKGPTALLNGVPPSGAIGGAINLVPKRATGSPIFDVGVSYLADGNVGGNLDVGRRFGPADEFGARFNLAHRQGSTAIDFGRERETVASLSLDQRFDRLRFFQVLNYEKQRMNAAGFSSFSLAPGVPVPKAPKGNINPAPPWTYTDTERLYGLVRAEYDLADNWTASLGYGYQHIDEFQYVAFENRILNTAGDFDQVMREFCTGVSTRRIAAAWRQGTQPRPDRAPGSGRS